MPHVALGGVLSLGVCEKVINHLRMKKKLPAFRRMLLPVIEASLLGVFNLWR